MCISWTIKGLHPVVDTQSEDCHYGTEQLCQRSKVGSKRRFCSEVLCVSADDDYEIRRVGSTIDLQHASALMPAVDTSTPFGGAPAAPVAGTVLKL